MKWDFSGNKNCVNLNIFRTRGTEIIFGSREFSSQVAVCFRSGYSLIACDATNDKT